MDHYLRPTCFVDSDHPAIIELAHRLAAGETDQQKLAVTVFNFVRDTIVYSTRYIRAGYEASQVLKRGAGHCVHKAILLAALARALNIPCRIGIWAIRNHKLNPQTVEKLGTNLLFPHASNQLMLNGTWFSVCAAFDQDMCRNIGVPVVIFDGVHDAMLPPYDLKGNKYIEYLDFLGYHEDIPVNLIFENLPRYYGEKYIELLDI